MWSERPARARSRVGRDGGVCFARDTGFRLAEKREGVMPVQSSIVDISTPDGVADAYLTRPDDNIPHPGVLFIMDAFGLRPRIEEMADRIAASGYVVLVPNMFYRAGRAPVLPFPDLNAPNGRTRFFEAVSPLLEQLTSERVARDGTAYLEYLATIVPGAVGISGYCMGARMGMGIAATHPDRVAAFAGFHGGNLVTDASDSPHLLAGQITAELYFGHADDDPNNT